MPPMLQYRMYRECSRAVIGHLCAAFVRTLCPSSFFAKLCTVQRSADSAEQDRCLGVKTTLYIHTARLALVNARLGTDIDNTVAHCV